MLRMAMKKAIVTSLFTAILIAFSIIVIPSSVAAMDHDDSGTSAPPLIYVLEQENSGVSIDYAQHTNHPVIYSDTGNVTLWAKILMPYQVYNANVQNTVMWVGGHLTSVSYKTSWQNNNTIDFFSSNSKTELDFNLTNIPYGNHHLEVNASCVVLILDQWSPLSSHPFYDSARKTLDFTVAPNIQVLSPESTVYNTSNIPLDFTITLAAPQITYSFDGEANTTINGNTTLTGLANGEHNITFYATDKAGNFGASETISFSVDVPLQTTFVVAVSGITVTVAAVVAALVYWKKRNRRGKTQ